MNINKLEDNIYHFDFNLRFDFNTIIAIFLIFLCIISMSIITGAMYVNNKYQKKYEFLMFEMQKETTRRDIKCIQHKKLMEELDISMEDGESIEFREHLR